MWRSKFKWDNSLFLKFLSSIPFFFHRFIEHFEKKNVFIRFGNFAIFNWARIRMEVCSLCLKWEQLPYLIFTSLLNRFFMQFYSVQVLQVFWSYLVIHCGEPGPTCRNSISILYIISNMLNASTYADAKMYGTVPDRRQFFSCTVRKLLKTLVSIQQ